MSWTARPNPGLHVVRYEDMLERPQNAFGNIVKFLRLDATRQRIDKAIRHASFKVLRNQEERDGFHERSEHAERFFRSGKAGAWRDALTPRQVAAVVERHSKQMARFGYLPTPDRTEASAT